MKKYSINKILTEGDAVLTLEDSKVKKILNPKFQKLINAAAISAAGASVAFLYVQREFLISGVKGFCNYVKMIADTPMTTFSKVGSVLSSTIVAAINGAFDIITGQGGGSKSEKIILLASIAIVSSFICWGIYKIFKFIIKKIGNMLESTNYKYNDYSLNIKEIKTELKNYMQNTILEADLNQIENVDYKLKKTDSIVGRSLNKVKEMWNWVLTSSLIRKSSITIVLACIITMCVAILHIYLGKRINDPSGMVALNADVIKYINSFA